jgi:Eco47II restriction endonuclease
MLDRCGTGSVPFTYSLIRFQIYFLMNYLPYISDADLEVAVQKVLSAIALNQEKAEQNLHKNVIDPFSAIFDAVFNQISLEEWLAREKTRQVQKSVQNKIGEFHENILGHVAGWEKLKQGVDIRNIDRKIIAEIKNKHNTVKGSDKVGIYDYLESKLQEPFYSEFTAYYVEIVPKKREPYDIPFTPSDRTSGKRRPSNPKIRQMSGQAFYHLVTGYELGLTMLFEVLPDVISAVSKVNSFSLLQKGSFQTLFNRTY